MSICSEVVGRIRGCRAKTYKKEMWMLLITGMKENNDEDSKEMDVWIECLMNVLEIIYSHGSI